MMSTPKFFLVILTISIVMFIVVYVTIDKSIVYRGQFGIMNASKYSNNDLGIFP